MAPPHLLLQGAAVIVSFLVSQTQSTSVHARMASAVSCVTSERHTLLSFKESLLDPGGRLSSWQGEDCCRWKGIGCSNRTGHVIKLDLRTNYEVQESELVLLGGEMSSSIVALRQLRYLDLSSNFFTIRIPSFLGNLRNLRYLNLSGASFSGNIPPQLGNLSSLQRLDLSYSFGLTSDLSWVRHLPLLRYLDMSTVDLASARDWVHEVNMLPALEVLHLWNCHLNSTVYTLSHSNLTHLEVLDLGWNRFNSPLLHNWFWDLRALKLLILEESGWSGPIPDALGNMSSLEKIYLDNNYRLGNIPTTLKKLCNLQVLCLSMNSINRSIAELMERLPKCSWNKMRMLDLHGAYLTGELPIWVGNLTGLSYLDLSQNLLVGHVPSGIGALGNLTFLGLGFNNLSGVLSKEHFWNLVNMEYMNLSRNSLKLDLGEDWIPPFRIKEGYFGSCDLGPQFPTWLRWQTGIAILDISNTSINDDLPDWFWAVVSNSSNLYLSWNQLSGALPVKLELLSMVEMDLSSNSFSGQLPNLTVPHLRALQLQSNHLTGTIPAYVCQLYGLQEINLSNNKLYGDFPQCPESSSMHQFGSFLSILDLKNNNLSGDFPCFLQNAARLVFLDLSHNKFFGRVPAWIGKKNARPTSIDSKIEYILWQPSKAVKESWWTSLFGHSP